MKTSKTSSGNSMWLALLACGVALVALSIATFVNAESVLGLLVYVAGVALCGVGAALAVVSFLPNRREERPRLLTLAAGNALLGALVMVFSRFALIFVGVALAIDGVGAALNALRQRKKGKKSRLAEIFLGVAFCVLGVVVVLFHAAIQTLIGTLGLLLLIAGLLLSIIGLLTRSPQTGAGNTSA
ncbi:MAG: DUF308 domain-containing protein [Prevotellaceae bacterium]|nr:DUF308 domain-containing protein [Prevotellaceae bacterium]